MKTQVLFVTEKWCDANPKLALTNNFHNLFRSFENSRPDCTYNTLHLDECSMIYGSHVDNIIPEYCKVFDTKIIFYSLLGLSKYNPSIATFKKVKSLGVKQCIMWPDTGPGWGVSVINQIGDAVDLNILWDNPTSDFHNSVINSLQRTLSLWVPQDNTMFCDNEKTIDVSFIGSDRYPDRKMYIDFLLKESKKNDINFIFSGGQREEKLSVKQYADLIKSSKIGINFSGNPGGFHQCKGRVYEILSSKSMLLENVNDSTRKLFTPGIDYIEFNSPQDLIEKIKYYLLHEEERIKIANNGYNKYISNYSSKIFWDTIIDKLYE